MTTRYYAEELCEHGNLLCNWAINGCVERPNGVCFDPSHRCPGGVRRELTDVETVELDTGYDFEDATGLIVGVDPGRYAIIPLPPEADE